MSSKFKTQKQTAGRKKGWTFDRIITSIEENKNLVYIAIIGFCLSVTVLYKLGQFLAWWK